MGSSRMDIAAAGPAWRNERVSRYALLVKPITRAGITAQGRISPGARGNDRLIQEPLMNRVLDNGSAAN